MNHHDLIKLKALMVNLGMDASKGTLERFWMRVGSQFLIFYPCRTLEHGYPLNKRMEYKYHFEGSDNDYIPTNVPGIPQFFDQVYALLEEYAVKRRPDHEERYSFAVERFWSQRMPSEARIEYYTYGTIKDREVLLKREMLHSRPEHLSKTAFKRRDKTRLGNQRSTNIFGDNVYA